MLLSNTHGWRTTFSFNKYFLSTYYGNIIRDKPCPPEAQRTVQDWHANEYVCLTLGCNDRNSSRVHWRHTPSRSSQRTAFCLKSEIFFFFLIKVDWGNNGE